MFALESFETVNEKFAKNIVALRNSRGVTQGQVADAIGISRQSVTLYETGKRIPDIVVLGKFAEYFGVSTDYLLGLSINSSTENQVIGQGLGLCGDAIERLKLFYEYRSEFESLSSAQREEYLHYMSLKYIINDPLFYEKIFDKYPKTGLFAIAVKATVNDSKSQMLFEIERIENSEQYQQKYTILLRLLNQIYNLYSDLYEQNIELYYDAIHHYLSDSNDNINRIICDSDLIFALGDYLYNDKNSKNETAWSVFRDDSFSELLELLVKRHNENATREEDNDQ